MPRGLCVRHAWTLAPSMTQRPGIQLVASSRLQLPIVSRQKERKISSKKKTLMKSNSLIGVRMKRLHSYLLIKPFYSLQFFLLMSERRNKSCAHFTLSFPLKFTRLLGQMARRIIDDSLGETNQRQRREKKWWQMECCLESKIVPECNHIDVLIPIPNT